MRFICILLYSLFLAVSAHAHEYWIEPKTYVLPLNSTVTAGLFNGQKFSGGEFTYFPKDIRRFDLALGDRTEPVQGRLGDRPALNTSALGDGLHVAIYETAGDIVHYNDLAAFGRFAAHKNFLPMMQRHLDRGLPTIGFEEFYTRHAKSLIAVGSGTGQDKAYGLETEIVVLTNPYTDDISSGVKVRVIYRSAPRVKAQVELFEKDAAGKVTITFRKTDEKGEAMLQVTPGHSYLVDAVVIREPESGSPAATKGAVWESLWAATTFAVPAK
jgi:hypothetical protein